jgi:hypothetical protein
MLRLRCFFRLCGEFVAYSAINRSWWVLGLTLALAFATLLVTIGQAAAPITIYPLF